MNKEISKVINTFFKKNKGKKIKKVNNLCAKKKAKCPYTVKGNCRGYCTV